jgi:hypothetical protein
MQNKFVAVNASVLALLGLGALAQPAAAGRADIKIYPATMCVPEGKAIGNPNLQVNANGGNAIVNTSTTSDVTVVCPIIRDNGEFSHAVPSFGKPTRVVVRFFDKNNIPGTLNSVQCTLRSFNSDGVVVASRSVRSKDDGAGNTIAGLELGPLNYEDGVAAFQRHGYMQLQCIIPKAITVNGLTNLSGIRAYEVQENFSDTTNPITTDEEL